MEYVTTKFGYCNKCDLPKAVAELKISGFLYAFNICGECTEKLFKKIITETARAAERAVTNDLATRSVLTTNTLMDSPTEIAEIVRAVAMEDGTAPEPKVILVDEKRKSTKTTQLDKDKENF